MAMMQSLAGLTGPEEIAALLEDFDALYLKTDPVTGHAHYPVEVTPVVREIQRKLLEFEVRSSMEREIKGGPPSDAMPSGAPAPAGGTAGERRHPSIMWEVGTEDDLSFLRRKLGRGPPAARGRPAPIKPAREARALDATEQGVNDAILATLARISSRLAPGAQDRRSAGEVDDDDVASLRRKLAAALADKAALEDRLAHAAEHNRSKTLPLAQQLQQALQREREKDAEIARLKDEIAGIRAEGPQVVTIPHAVPIARDAPEQEYKLSNEDAEEMERLRDEVEDAHEMVQSLHRNLYDAQNEADGLRMDLDSFTRNIDKDKMGLLEQIAALERDRKRLNDSLALANFSVETSESDLAGHVESSKSMGKQLAATAKQATDAARHLALVQQQLGATMARVGREKLRMACARYLSIWYRDRFRTGSAGAAATAAEAAELRRRVQDGRVTFVSNNPELEQEIEDQQKALVALQAKLADALRQREADAKRATDAEKALHDRDGLLIKQQADLDRAKVALQQAEDQLSRGLNASDLLGNAKGLATEDGILRAAQEQLLHSALDSFHGDYAGARNDAKILAHLYSRNDRSISFSDVVQVINHQNKYLRKILVVSDTAVYLFDDASSRALESYVSIANVSHLSASRFAADLLAIHHRKRLDTVIVTPKRLEVIFVLQIQYLRAFRTPLTVQCAERIYVADDAENSRDIRVVSSQQIHLGDSTRLLVGT